MRKLSFSLLSFILVSIIVLGWALDVLFETYFTDSEIGPVQEYQQLGTQLARMMAASEVPQKLVDSWQAESLNDLVLLERSEMPLPSELWPSLERGEPLILETDEGLTLYFWLAEHQKLMALTPTALRNDESVATVRLLLTTVFYVCVLVLLIVWLLPLMRSLRRLRKSALAYGEGDFSARIEATRFTYIDDIENTFNRMADQIETLIQDNKLISSAVSHDLRTPLARLRFGIDVLMDSENAEEREKYQQHLSNDIDEMQSLVDALLNYAKLEQALVALDKAPVDLSEILIHYQQTHPKDLIQLENAGNLPVLGERTYLQMMLHNLLNNALKYGNGQILVTSEQTADHVCVAIHDDGDGIAQAQQNDLFKPFVRGEANQNSGYGMGLAIVERITHWHEGSVDVERSNRLGGAVFIVCLPKAKH